MVSRVCDLNEAPSIIFRSIFYSSRVCFAYKINIQHCWHFSLYFILICKLWHFKWGFKKVSRKSSDNIRFFNWFIDNSWENWSFDWKITEWLWITFSCYFRGIFVFFGYFNQNNLNFQVNWAKILVFDISGTAKVILTSKMGILTWNTIVFCSEIRLTLPIEFDLNSSYSGYSSEYTPNHIAGYSPKLLRLYLGLYSELT